MDLVPGILALLLAAPLALLVNLVHETLRDQTERAFMVIGAIYAGVIVLPVAIPLLFRRKSLDPRKLGLIMIGTIGVVLASVYMYRVSFYVLFPADILTWSESDFVNDIVKFRVGYPIYTAEVNNESFTYAPGAQLLTYFLAWLTGNPTSVALYRFIQLVYSLLAAIVATDCCRRLVEIALPSRRLGDRRLWSALWLLLLFLMATNGLTNLYTHNLHNDALAQLVSAIAYWVLLRYVSTGEKRFLALAALVPAAGYFSKQSLAVWAVLYCIQLALFDSSRSVKRLVGFVLAAFGVLAMVLGVSYLLWGSDFFYWTFTVLARHGISPARSFQHVLDVWPYLAIGLLGGFVLLRGKNFKVLLGPWVIWLILILFESYTSGAASMLNHIGPGCLIAGVWFLAGLVRVWPMALVPVREGFRARSWMRAGIAVSVVALVLAGLGVVRMPMRPFPEDAYRYVNEIEREFEGQPVETTLLDMGSWVYLRDGVVMKDRAPAIGERGYSDSGDFSGVIQRLERKHYSKILVHNLHSPEFWYDYGAWRKSSGIKQTLLENYHEVNRIRGVTGQIPRWVAPYGLSEITVLMPNQN